MESSTYKYKFSIVMAVYNVEEYLEEAIESVVNQIDIDFENEVQLILVNDGSSDNSHDICVRYKEMYPNSIVYIKKENGGVSSARNKGLEFVQGKYVNFMDSDDKLSEDCLSNVYDFFEENYDETDVVSIPVNFFGAKNGKHILNYKHTSNRVINLLIEYNKIQLFTNSVFIKSEIACKYIFDCNLKYGEDAKYINQILLEKCTLGITPHSKYLYRKRENETSAMDKCKDDPLYYLNVLTNFNKDILDYSERCKGYIPKFIQFMVMYDLQWRYKLDSTHIDNFFEYKELFYQLISRIDGEVIKSQRNLYLSEKYHLLEIKSNFNRNNWNIFFDTNKYNITFKENNNYFNILSEKNVYVILKSIKLKNNKLVIKGKVNNYVYFEKFGFENFKLNIIVNNKRSELDITEDYMITNKCLGEVLSFGHEFTTELDIEENLMNFNFELVYKNKQNLNMGNIMFGDFTNIFPEHKYNYIIRGDNYISFDKNIQTFTLLNKSLVNTFKLESKRFMELIKLHKYKIAFIRVIVIFLREIKRKPNWIFMDRIEKADDNSEALINYISNIEHNVNLNFAIKKETDDFERLKHKFKVLNFGSYLYKLKLLNTDVFISSHLERYLTAPLRDGGKYLSDLLDFKYVFLQHGVTKDKINNWFCTNNSNVDFLITSTKFEYDYFLSEPGLGYTKETVKLVGFPRYDLLEDGEKNKEKYILIAPTWRSSIIGKKNSKTKKVEYSEGFKETNYFNAYNRLLNDVRLNRVLEKNEFKIIFFPHPNTRVYDNDYTINKNVIVENYSTQYRELIKKASILITDYSSVSFDYAYLKKPMFYYQFDKDEVYSGKHTYNGTIFDYNLQGFGEVLEEHETLIDKIIEKIEGNCIMDDKFKQRVDNTFAYSDKNNSERVYNEILTNLF